MLLALEAPDAIKKWRDAMGATDPAKADAGTLRKDFGESIGRNATHGSDAPETAAFELGYFFRGMELLCRPAGLEAWQPEAPHGPTTLIVVGLLIAAVGAADRPRRAAWAGCRATSPYRRGNFSFYFPLATSILVSVVLTLVCLVLGQAVDRRGAFRCRRSKPTAGSRRWRSSTA